MDVANAGKIGWYGAAAFLGLVQLADCTLSTVRQNGFGLDEPFEARKESGIYPADVKCFRADIPHQRI